MLAALKLVTREQFLYHTLARLAITYQALLHLIKPFYDSNFKISSQTVVSYQTLSQYDSG